MRAALDLARAARTATSTRRWRWPASLGLFWHLGRHLEGREVLGRLLERGDGCDAGPGAARCRRCPSSNGHAAAWCTPARAARRPRRRACAIFEQLGDPSRAALSRGAARRRRRDRRRTPNAPERLLRRGRGAVRSATATPGVAAVIGFVRMETALKTGDEANAVPIGRADGGGVPAARRPLGPLGHPVPPRAGGCGSSAGYEEGARVLEEAIDVAASAGLYNTVQWALADLAVETAPPRRPARQAARPVRPRRRSLRAGRRRCRRGPGRLRLRPARPGRRRLGRAAPRFAEAMPGFERFGTPVPQGLVAGRTGPLRRGRGRRPQRPDGATNVP